MLRFNKLRNFTWRGRHHCWCQVGKRPTSDAYFCAIDRERRVVSGAWESISVHFTIMITITNQLEFWLEFCERGSGAARESCCCFPCEHRSSLCEHRTSKFEHRTSIWKEGDLYQNKIIPSTLNKFHITGRSSSKLISPSSKGMAPSAREEEKGNVGIIRSAKSHWGSWGWS
jgi:hypothetical protein